ncbi:hypothetical protein HELRODRAFT_65246 [Helobdella robusta]|uniref:DNA-directed RNA polymerases I, II, and III subunit RPABC1 n=1 Tax=Helobdella robusta TaxID=6412 RepID=T1FY50_HELRO|nr:hypothetical protein HELRODRAFT_65246 [Helobdella robusta]ESO02260.1 hypothetical protein HELRODRAFT_65246 [Helobdella robusta]
MGEISDVYKLWRIRKTIYEMCNDRGYRVTDAELNEPLQTFQSYYDQLPSKTEQTMIFKHSTNSADSLMVFFGGAEKISGVMAKNFMARMLEEKCGRALLIISNVKAMTSIAKKDIEEAVPTYNIDVFTEIELLVNVTRHKLVPQHILLSQEEAAKVLEKYKAKDHHLPRMLSSDPIARYYGMKKGQIVKIIRKSETAGVYVTYRVVL